METSTVKEKTIEILNTLLKEIMKFPAYEKLSCAQCILDFCKKIDNRKIKIDTTIARLYKILEPINTELLNDKYEVLELGQVFEIVPGINITKVYKEMDLDSKKIIFKYLAVLKCNANFLTNNHIEETTTVYQSRLDGLLNYHKNKTTEEIKKASDEIKDMFAPMISSSSLPTLNNLVNEISAKLNSNENLEDSIDMRSFFTMASELAEKNKENFVNGKVNVAEMTQAASSVMRKIYAESDTDLKQTLGFDPAELLDNMMSGNSAPNLDEIIGRLPKEQKKMMKKMMKK